MNVETIKRRLAEAHEDESGQGVYIGGGTLLIILIVVLLILFL